MRYDTRNKRLAFVEQNNKQNIIREKAEKYRAKLLNFGMQEPSKRDSSDCHWYYFKPMTDLTAFIVNLTLKEQLIETAEYVLNQENK